MKKHQSKRKLENIWQIQEAKAQFSLVIENATKNGSQTITKNGKPVAVIISKSEYDQLSKPETSLLDFFKAAPYPEVELDIQRSKDLPRELEL